MKIWVDAQLSPALAAWLAHQMGITAEGVRALGLRDAYDRDIFFAARSASAIVMTKDRDFVDLVNRHGAPPQVIWITCGNTSNARLQTILLDMLPRALALLESGETVVEITDP
ncbi:MAG: DUF5615 family PIN-like protein [Chloroflexi bacterium]|nr:DUF5615 family PIN-like protein [Chloroflexota bacterium]